MAAVTSDAKIVTPVGVTGKCIETTKVVVDGKMVNGKLIGPVLGEGAFGKVRLCTDTTATPNVQYAAKIMSRMKLKNKKQYTSGGGGMLGGGGPPMMKRMEVKTMYDKVKSEIALMKRLGQHSNIAVLYEVMDDPECDDLYLILELATNGQIMKWDGESRSYKTDPKVFGAPTSDGGMNESDARELFVGAVSGLEFLHAAHVLHRDIKPDNLLFTVVNDSGSGSGSGQPKRKLCLKIVDFGVSKDCELAGASDEARAAAAVLSDTAGTDYYQPPECGTGDSYNGYSADVWSLGVTLYVMLFGVLPWYDDMSAAVFDKISADPLAIPPAGKSQCALSAECVDLLRRILEKEPNQRLTIPQIKAHAWFNGKSTPATAATNSSAAAAAAATKK